MEETKATVRVIASDQNWIEGDALQQLDKTASWQGMRLAVGMPDLHPGKGTPVGAAFVSEGIFYPYLVGNDIGCGMALWATDLKTKKVRLDRWTDRLVGLEIGWDGDVASQLAADGAEPSGFEEALGTIGGGNHFAELQKIASIEVPEVADGLGLRRDRLVLLVHSGSRGFGESILRKHIDRFKSGGLEEGSEAAAEYLDRHDKAVAWARVNRRIIAKRFLSMLGGDGERSLDVCHNFVERMPFGDGTAWIHRKGAAPSNQGIAVIPGSRGALSYVVEPTGDQSLGAWSLAHGAGRSGRARTQGAV